MSKSNIKKVETAAGQLKYNRHFELTVSDNGTGSDNVNFANYTFENGNFANHVKIMNDGGSNSAYFVFDAEGSTIDTSDNTTYNGKVYAGTPYSEIGYDGSATSIGFKCESGLSTTIKLLVW